MPKTFNQHQDDFHFEYIRLESFKRWPNDWLDPSSLAKDGFYYTGKEDQCACVYCNGIIAAACMYCNGTTAGSEPGKPRELHQHYFPECSFLKGKPVGNVPLGLEDSIYRIRRQLPPHPSLKNIGYRNDHGRYYSSSDLPENIIIKHKEFSTYDDRLKSFTDWPLNINPTVLADAGFFYCGIRDHVRCFDCGGGLREWEGKDDPWIEHARWYPSCRYIIYKKGKSYIDEMSTFSVSEDHVIAKEMDTVMDLDVVKYTIDLGYPVKSIREALYHYIWSTGTVFMNVDDCIRNVLITIYRKELPPCPENNHVQDEIVKPYAVNNSDVILPIEDDYNDKAGIPSYTVPTKLISSDKVTSREGSTVYDMIIPYSRYISRIMGWLQSLRDILS
nr:MAG: baculoviral IAP repeat-containing protein [Penaeus semisulcatus pemonivirus]